MERVLLKRWLEYQGAINGAGRDMKIPVVLGWDDRLQKTLTGHPPKLPNDHRKVESKPSISPAADFRF